MSGTTPDAPARDPEVRHSPERSAEVRRRYGELIDTLLVQGDTQHAARCAQLAVDAGVWRDPQQRPGHYLPAIEPRPVHDPADFWFVGHLEENYSLIRAELDTVTDPASEGFLPVEERLLGRGRWDQVTLYEAGYRFEDACRRFPVTASVVDAIPEATSAGPGVVTLSWLYPGTHVVPHCGGTNARLRVHLGLHVPPGPALRVADRHLTWAEGRCVVFDDSFEHEVWHEGDQPRVVLLLDVPHPGLSAEVVERMLAARTTFEQRVAGFMTERGIARIEVDGEEVGVRVDRGMSGLVLRHLREVGASWAELDDGHLRYG